MSSVDTDKLEDILESDILGLGGQEKGLSVLYLCTIWRRGCLAALATTLKDQLEGQKTIKALEATRSRKRRELFDAQDAIDQ